MTQPILHIAVYGAPGSGKSSFIATAPKPLLVCFFDAVGKDPPYLRCGSVEEYRDDSGTRVSRVAVPSSGAIDVEYYNDIDARTGNAWERFRWRLEQRAFLDQGYATLAIDSVTFMELCARKYDEYVVNPTAKDPRKWHGAATTMLEEALLLRMMDLRINVIIAMHVSQERDDATGGMLRSPSAPGRLQAKGVLPAGYGELYRTHVVSQPNSETAYVLQTRSDNTFFATSQIDAPNPSWNCWEALWTNWHRV